MNEIPASILEQMRDIHGAAEPGWWPPAPGWWLLGVLLLAVLLFAGLKLFRAWRRQRRRAAYLAAVDGLLADLDPSQQPRDYLAVISRAFRVIALRAFPTERVARLEGEQWCQFLMSRVPPGTPAEPLRVLAYGPYQVHPDFDAAELLRILQQWIRRHG